MAGRVPTPPRATLGVSPIEVDDPQVKRALDAIRSTVESLLTTRTRVVVEFDLVVGTNKVRHGLGRAVAGYTITPTVADATFAHCLNRNNPRPELEVWIDVVGVAQPGAIVEAF